MLLNRLLSRLSARLSFFRFSNLGKMISGVSSNWNKLQQKQIKDDSKIGKNKTKKRENSFKNKEQKSNIKIRKTLPQLAKEDKLRKDIESGIQKSNLKESNDGKPVNQSKQKGKKINNLSNRQQEIGKYLAIDCEFVGIGPEGLESSLARVSIVNFHGHLIYDKYVQPREKVTDWRTFVSGIRPSDMKDAISFKQAQKEVSDLLENRILVGHAVHHDLEALYLTHPKSKIRDTASHLPFKKKYSKGKTPSLKKLAAEILKIDIQGGEHSSVEDARATMLIYKSDKAAFEKKHNK